MHLKEFTIKFFALVVSSESGVNPLDLSLFFFKWQGCPFLGRRSFIIEFPLLQVNIILKGI